MRAVTCAILLVFALLSAPAWSQAPDAKIPPPTDVAKPPGDATTTESGLVTRRLQPGMGTAHPGPEDRVEVHYTGWTTDGEMFDSSRVRGQPLRFNLNQVIPGWTEGLQLMVEGEKRRLWIPAELAYGENPGAGRPAGMLVFDVELIAIFKAPPAPEDVAEPPAAASFTSSGLASRVLEAGTGSTHPGPTDMVEVHYTGWTTDGEMFDSSRTRGKSVRFPLNRVIPGWTEGLQLMVEGEERRLWIPAELAYGENTQGGRPAGMLVFDVELIAITPAPKPVAPVTPVAPSTPPDVAEPPASAIFTDSGLATRVLRPGSGTRKPGPEGTVVVHYTGWTTDGAMFDSSHLRGEPATFPVSGLIEGFAEALQMMVEGEQRRVWIPVELAYKNAPGKPAGMLVFDIELIAIE